MTSGVLWCNALGAVALQKDGFAPHRHKNASRLPLRNVAK
jgi:hypothetical protein